MHAHMAWKGESRYKNCIVTVGDAATWPAILPGARMTHRNARDTARTAHDMGLNVTIQFCIATKGRQYGRRCPATRRPGSLIRLSTRHDTTPCAPRRGAVHMVWAQCSRSVRATRVHGCVHCALDLVLTQCTVLSHYLDQCQHYS